MRFKHSFIIPTPFKLDWTYVSPVDANGFDYHLTSDLTIRIRQIFGGEYGLDLARLMVIEADEHSVNEMQINHMWQADYLPAKSAERVNRALSKKDVTCYFTEKQIKVLEENFNNKAYTSGEVSVIYRGLMVDDIVELSPADYEKVLEAFAELNVQQTLDYRASREELEEQYRESYEKRIAYRANGEKQKLFDRLRNKDMRKKAIKSVGVTMLGIAGFVARRLLIHKGPWGIAAAIVLGTAGAICETFGRVEMGGVVSDLAGRVSDRGGFM